MSDHKPVDPDTQHSAPGPQYSLDPRVLAAMYGVPEEDEIDLFEYWNILWKRKVAILAAVFVAAVIAAGVSLLMTEIYRAEALLAPTQEEGGQKSRIASMLGGLGGLASSAGISLGGGTTQESLAVLKSREFLWKFVEEEKLMPILFADAWDAEAEEWIASDPEARPDRWDAYRKLTAMLTASQDMESGLVTLAVEWEDPVLAARWANKLVDRLNAHLRRSAIERSAANLTYLQEELDRTRVADMRQTLFELIAQEQQRAMLANTQEEFAFRVLDPAEPPDRKVRPNRKLIVILAALVTGFVAVAGIFIYEAVARRREESGGE